VAGEQSPDLYGYQPDGPHYDSLNLLMVPIFYQQIILGLVILAAVMVRTFEENRPAIKIQF